MSTTPTEVLKQYAHALELAAPREFAAFVECFDAFATEITVAVTNAQQTEILNVQGRAQLALHLLRAFRECGKPRTHPQQPTQP